MNDVSKAFLGIIGIAAVITAVTLFYEDDQPRLVPETEQHSVMGVDPEQSYSVWHDGESFHRNVQPGDEGSLIFEGGGSGEYTIQPAQLDGVWTQAMPPETWGHSGMVYVTMLSPVDSSDEWLSVQSYEAMPEVIQVDLSETAVPYMNFYVVWLVFGGDINGIENSGGYWRLSRALGSS